MPAIELDTLLPGTRRQVLERHADVRVAQGHRCQRTPVLIGKALDEWDYRNNVRLHFIELGKRTFGNIVPVDAFATSRGTSSASLFLPE